jgi:hypothetical protein
MCIAAETSVASATRARRVFFTLELLGESILEIIE